MSSSHAVLPVLGSFLVPVPAEILAFLQQRPRVLGKPSLLPRTMVHPGVTHLDLYTQELDSGAEGGEGGAPGQPHFLH